MHRETGRARVAPSARHLAPLPPLAWYDRSHRPSTAPIVNVHAASTSRIIPRVVLPRVLWCEAPMTKRDRFDFAMVRALPHPETSTSRSRRTPNR